jgi:hypothetical protein
MATKTTQRVDIPSEVEPGDAPFDTTDPTERVTSIDNPDKGAAAAAGFGTVNAVMPLSEVEQPRREQGKARTERYQATAPNGKLVTVERNIETGDSKVV